MRNLVLLLAGVIFLASCNTSYEKTKSGLRYKIIKGKGGKQLKVGDFIQFDQVVLIPEKDTILFTTYGKVHAYDRVDTGLRTQYSYQEILPKCSVGDSIVAIISADSLLRKGMIQAYNNILKKGTMVTIRMRITKSYTSEAEIRADIEKESKAKSAGEVKELEDYLAKNKIQYVKTPSGAYVEVSQKGTGPVAEQGATAEVLYTGKLLKNGSVFDSNVDPKFGHTDPYPVQVGSGGSIRGLEEGLMYFAKGGKGKVYIPSFLGYGEQGNGDKIPGYSSLVFEVEIKDIKPPTAAPTTPPANKP